MATRKCGNIYFPKYFMAARPYLTRNFFKNYLGWRGQKNSLKKFGNLKISDRLLRSKNFFKKIFLVLYAAYVYPLWVVSL